MNTKAFLSALLALSMSVSGFAVAQRGEQDNRGGRAERGDRDDARNDARNGSRNDNRFDNRNDNRGDNRFENRDRHRDRDRNVRPGRAPRADAERWQDRPDYRAQPQWYRSRDGRYYGRGAGPDHSIHRGARLPSYYRNGHYVVYDWRSHQLSSPPRGYHWVQTGSDYVLVAIATGIILELLLSD